MYAAAMSGNVLLPSVYAVAALGALTRPGRLGVFRRLVRTGPVGLVAGKIARVTGSLPNTLSSNRAILAGAGLVRSLREGRSVIYSAERGAASRTGGQPEVEPLRRTRREPSFVYSIGLEGETRPMRIRSIWMWIMPMIGLLLVACGGGGGGGSTPAPSAPAISAFSASSAQVQPGQSVTLSWTVQGATSLTISPGVGSVVGLSSQTVSPAATTTYVLTAANAFGSVTASTTVTVASAPYPPGLAPGNLQVGGVTREFRVYTPSGMTGPPKALVLVLHGGGGAGLNIANPGAHPLSVFRDVADREGFIVVYPGGQPATDGSPGWNDCRSDNQTSSNANDIAFLNALIEQLRTGYGLPTSKVFMAGGSNGAQMTLSYALAGPANVAAVASSHGNMAKTPKPGACSALPPRRLPVLMVHGTEDPAMPYAGGCVANQGGLCNRGEVVSAEATRDFWRQANGATGTPVQTVFNGNTSDPGPANRLFYSGPSDVEWWRLDGAGHPVTSQKVLIPTSPESGPQNRDVEFAEIAWAFFKSKL